MGLRVVGGRKTLLVVALLLVGVTALPRVAEANGYCPGQYSFAQRFGSGGSYSSYGYGYGYGSGNQWYEFGGYGGSVGPGYGYSPEAACHDYFSGGTLRTELFCGPVGLYRPVMPPGPQPPPGGGAGPGPVPADTVERILGAAIRLTREKLANPSCNAYLSGATSGDADAATVFTNVQGGGRLVDTLEQRQVEGTRVFAQVDQIGAGSGGTITLFLPFYNALNDPSYYNATMDTFSPPLSPDEMKALIILHEVAHLTGANRHYDEASNRAFDYGIVVNCFR